MLLSSSICFAESGSILFPAFKIELPKINTPFIKTTPQLNAGDIIREIPAMPVNSHIEDVARLQSELKRAV